MPLFTSKRERRLWLWAAAVLLAIYATLGLAGSLAEVLRELRLDFYLFLFGMIFVAAVVLIQGLTEGTSAAVIGVALGVAAAYYMVFARMTFPERSHLIEYSVLAALIYQALLERARNRGNIKYPALAALLLTTLLGWLDEGIQWLLPNRYYDNVDVLFNALAALMAISALAALNWVRRRSLSSKSGGNPPA